MAQGDRKGFAATHQNAFYERLAAVLIARHGESLAFQIRGA